MTTWGYVQAISAANYHVQFIFKKQVLDVGEQFFAAPFGLWSIYIMAPGVKFQWGLNTDRKHLMAYHHVKSISLSSPVLRLNTSVLYLLFLRWKWDAQPPRP